MMGIDLPDDGDLARSAEDDLAIVQKGYTLACLEMLPAWIRRALAAEAEVVKLRSMVERFAERIVKQSDALGRCAEKQRRPWPDGVGPPVVLRAESVTVPMGTLLPQLGQLEGD